MVVLLARWLPCSLLPAICATGGKARNQHRQVQQVRHRPQRRRPVAAVPGRLGLQVSPGRRDQPLGPVRQHHQQLRPAMPPHAAQHRQLPAVERVPCPGNPHPPPLPRPPSLPPLPPPPPPPAPPPPPPA